MSSLFEFINEESNKYLIFGFAIVITFVCTSVKDYLDMNKLSKLGENIYMYKALRNNNLQN